MKKKLIKSTVAIALLTLMVQTTLSFSTKENNSNQVSSVAHSYHSGYPSKNISLSAMTIDVASQSAGGIAPFDKLHTKYEYSFDKDYPLTGSFFSKGTTFEFSNDFLGPWSSHGWGGAGSFSRSAAQSDGNQHSPFSSRPSLASSGAPNGGNPSDTPQSEKELSKDTTHPMDIPVSTGGPDGNLPQSNDQTKDIKPSGSENIPEDKSSNPDTFEPVITDSSDNAASAPEKIIEENDKSPDDIENISSDPLDPSCVIRPESCSVPGSSEPNGPQPDVEDINGDIAPTSPDNPSTPVPEPESFALLLTGILGLKLICRTKK